MGNRVSRMKIIRRNLRGWKLTTYLPWARLQGDVRRQLRVTTAGFVQLPLGQVRGACQVGAVQFGECQAAPSSLAPIRLAPSSLAPSSLACARLALASLARVRLVPCR